VGQSVARDRRGCVVTWLKLSDDFPDDLYRDELSDAAFRTHVEGLAWSCRHLLDGRLPARSLVRFAFTDDPKAAAAELVAAGYWEATGDGWQIVHHLEHQADRDTVLRRRQLTADRVARHRAAKLRKADRRKGREVDPDPDSDEDPGPEQGAGADPDPVTHAVTQGVTRYVTRDPGRAGTGRDGTGNSAVTTKVRKDEDDDEAGEVPACGWCEDTAARMERDGRPMLYEGRPWCGGCEPVDPDPPASGPTCYVGGCDKPATLIDSDGDTPLCARHGHVAFGATTPLPTGAGGNGTPAGDRQHTRQGVGRA
jgi:hypothetical protein